MAMSVQNRHTQMGGQSGSRSGADESERAAVPDISRLIQVRKVGELAERLDRWTGLWHRGPAVYGEGPGEFLGLLERLHLCNFMLWHEEDQARRRDVPAAVIVQHKRAIDLWNQRRNDTIEQVDLCLLEALQREGLPPSPEAPLNSETPGSILDRLSIAALKIYHMAEQTRRTDVDSPHRQKCAARHEVLCEQRQDLLDCLERLLMELLSGQKRLKLYRQFKMYNDPTLNPALYQGGD